MFIGHYALAFGAKKAAPAVSLGTLFLAAQLADLLWPILVLAGIETVEIRPGATRVTPLVFVYYPYSHSLLALILWGAAFAAVHRGLRNSRLATGFLLSALVVSHWFLDFLTHAPDMPLWPGGPRAGLGLWNSRPGTIGVELSLFLGGLVLYLRATRARNRRGVWALWSLVVFLLAAYLVNLFGPPPPGVAAVAGSAAVMWFLVAWGYWIDRNREALDGWTGDVTSSAPLARSHAEIESANSEVF